MSPLMAFVKKVVVIMLFSLTIILVFPEVARAPLYFLLPPPKILFVGDMMFDRAVRDTSDVKGGDYLFSCIAPKLKKYDLVVGNLEGPVTENASRSRGTVPSEIENFVFTFPTTTPSLLARNNIRIVNVGNNHIYNFGVEGVEETTHWLTHSNVDFFGVTQKGGKEGNESRVARTDIHGVPLSFVNWNQFGLMSASSTVLQIEREVGAQRRVIVFTHWGEEYAPATAREKYLAHLFVDAGATAIIGTHPHVIQENEIYKGSPIYYSLGNFIFDQYWEKSVREGQIVSITVPRFGPVEASSSLVIRDRKNQVCEKTDTKNLATP